MTRHPRHVRRATLLPTAVIAVALTLGLSACSASSEGTGASMHTSVVQIAERAAAGDYAGALAELALLDRELTAAVDAGTIDATQEQEIRAAMDLVRADLEAAGTGTTETPTSTPSSTPTPSDEAPGNSDDKGNKGEDDDKGKDNGKD
jgi:hypothetical protein